MQREKGQASQKQFTAIYTSSAFSLLKYEWNGTWKLQLNRYQKKTSNDDLNHLLQ